MMHCCRLETSVTAGLLTVRAAVSPTCSMGYTLDLVIN